MSFASGQIVGDAHGIEVGYEVKLDHEREQRVLKAVTAAVEEIAKELGGYLAVSTTGHVNDYESGVGDSVNIQLNSILPPPKPAQDAGLEAAGGSPRNFPPEASTAAPATEDNSPPATQEAIPQPAEGTFLGGATAAPLTPAEAESPSSTPALEPTSDTPAESVVPPPVVESGPTPDAGDVPSAESDEPTDLAPPTPEEDAEPVASPVPDGQAEAVQPSAPTEPVVAPSDVPDAPAQ